MFKLSEKNEVDRRILKCDFIRYSPSEISTINTANSQVYNIIHRKNSVISLLNSYLKLNFDVLQDATNNRYTDGDNIRLVKLGPIAFFSNYKLTKFSGKHFEKIDHAHRLSLLYKLLTSSRSSDDLSIGFCRSHDRRQRELTKNKNIKGKHHVRIYLKDNFSLTEHQEQATYGLGYKLTLKRNTDYAVLNKGNAINNGKIKNNSSEWYVPHNTPSREELKKTMKQIVDEIPTKLRHPKRSVFMKKVNAKNFWTFELGTQEKFNVPIWIFTVFLQSDREHDQKLDNNFVCRLPVSSAQCIIGNERYPDSSNFLNYDNDDYSQGYGQIKDVFKALTKDDLLQPFITEDHFRSSNDGDNIGYNIHDFDKGYQEIFEYPQPVKVEFKNSENIPADIYG